MDDGDVHRGPAAAVLVHLRLCLKRDEVRRRRRSPRRGRRFCLLFFFLFFLEGGSCFAVSFGGGGLGVGGLEGWRVGGWRGDMMYTES